MRVLFALFLVGCGGPNGVVWVHNPDGSPSGSRDLASSPGSDLGTGADLAMSGDLQPLPTCVPADRSVVHFVDPLYGRDDNMHGGAAGACAYKTLTFALPWADGEISLAEAAYGAPAEAAAFTLTGTQHLSCNNATLFGAVELKGTANGLDHCTVDGVKGVEECVTIYPVPMASHSIANSTITNCSRDGIFVGDGFLSVTNSTISGDGYGIEWYDSRTISGSMVNNNFADNETDILCDITTSAITGSINRFTGTGLVCEACDGCPYD